MSFDAVLDKDSNIIFSGTPEEVKTWLHKNRTTNEVRVFIGRSESLVTVEEYKRR